MLDICECHSHLKVVLSTVMPIFVSMVVSVVIKLYSFQIYHNACCCGYDCIYCDSCVCVLSYGYVYLCVCSPLSFVRMTVMVLIFMAVLLTMVIFVVVVAQ